MKKNIYRNDHSQLDIEFDGEHFLIIQSIDGIVTQQISVKEREFSRMSDFVNFFFGN